MCVRVQARARLCARVCVCVSVVSLRLYHLCVSRLSVYVSVCAGARVRACAGTCARVCLCVCVCVSLFDLCVCLICVCLV